MIEKNIEVLRKILYAVETGGQVYGKQRYDAFIGAGANTPMKRQSQSEPDSGMQGRQSGFCWKSGE